MTREAQRAPEHQHSAGIEALHVCLQCSSELVYPVEWHASDGHEWNVLLRCPDCEVHRQGAFRQRTVDALDAALVRGTDALRRDYKQLVAANMADETERFVSALHADAILPEDF
jgi:hypothetical protein